MRHAAYPKTTDEVEMLRNRRIAAGTDAAKKTLRKHRNVQASIESRRRKTEQFANLQKLVLDIRTQLETTVEEYGALVIDAAALRKENGKLREYIVNEIGVSVAAGLCKEDTTDIFR